MPNAKSDPLSGGKRKKHRMVTIVVHLWNFVLSRRLSI